MNEGVARRAQTRDRLSALCSHGSAKCCRRQLPGSPGNNKPTPVNSSALWTDRLSVALAHSCVRSSKTNSSEASRRWKRKQKNSARIFTKDSKCLCAWLRLAVFAQTLCVNKCNKGSRLSHPSLTDVADIMKRGEKEKNSMLPPILHHWMKVPGEVEPWSTVRGSLLRSPELPPLSSCVHA